MAQQDGSSRSQAQNSDSDERRRRFKGDELYSTLDDEADQMMNRESSTTNDQTEESQGWKNRVLATYKKTKGPRDTSTFLARIPEGKATFEIGDRHKSVSIQEAMIGLVERMFDAFQNYGYDFNREAAGTELELNWIRPVLTREASGGSVFSGRLSTRRWTMVVKGTPQEILAYILPADKLIGFSLSSTSFAPYLRLLPSSDGLDVRWKIDRTILTMEMFPGLFQDLFVVLIRHAQDLVRGPQQFDVSKIGGGMKKQAEDEEKVKQKYRDAFFEDMRALAESTSLAKTADTPISPQERRLKESVSGEHRTSDRHSGLHQATSRMWPQGQPNGWPAQQQKPEPNPGNSKPTGTGWTPPPEQLEKLQGKPMPIAPGAMSAPSPKQQPWPTSERNQNTSSASPANTSSTQSLPMQQPWAAPSQTPSATAESRQQAWPTGSSTQSQRTQQAQQQPFQTLQHQMQQMNQMRQTQSGRSEQSFASALSQLLGALERELEIVAKAGSEAFSQKDLARADAALKFSGRLTQFKESAQELLEYYKRK